MPEEEFQAALVLPDGRTIEYAIRRSSRAKALRLKLSASEGLVAIAPEELSRHKLLALVASKSKWIGERLANFDEVRHLIAAAPISRPQAFDLAALGESWRVEYRLTRGRTVRARTDRQGRIVVEGAIEDTEACKAALRRWLARHATAALTPWLASLSNEFGLPYSKLMIKSQRTRWGSCSPNGCISLNCKLLFIQRDVARYVLLHELCHTLVPNHSEKFWVRLRSIDSYTDYHHARMRDAWKSVPTWVHRAHRV